jgi:ADP-ribosylglycohydrolase
VSYLKPPLTKYRGSLIGQCLGDALGFPVEGQSPNICADYVKQYVINPPTRMIGRSYFPFGQYTDDSQLARELIQSYVENGGNFHPERYAKRIADIFADNRIVGRGFATDTAARNLIAGSSWEESGIPTPSAGNGSAMRAAPIGLFFFDDIDSLTQTAIDQGRITHHDSRCNAGAVAIAGAVAQVLTKESLNISHFIDNITTWTGPVNQIFASGIANLHRWLKLSPIEAVKEISIYGVTSDFVNDGWRGISPFVVSSVIWSLYAFLKAPNDYLKAMAIAIGVGGDVDTTAAMTGAISGAYLGLEALPQTLFPFLTDQGTWKYNELLNLADSCYNLKFRS